MKIRNTFWAVILFGLLAPFIWSNFSFATVGKPMIVYSEDETASIQSSQFNSSTNSWATATTAATTSRKQYWKVAKTHPKGNKKAVVSVENPASSDPYLYATLWDESNWDDGTGASYNDVKQLGQVYTNGYRCFDAAYEETSGKLLVVAASPTANTINYWTWNGTTWSSENTYTFSTALGNLHWIRLASNPKPGSNEIALVCLDNGNKVSVLIWNGSSWGNEANVSTSANTNTQEAIDIDYTKAGRGSYDGNAMAVWGQSTSIYFAYWNGSSWTYSSGHRKDVTGSPYWVRHKSDPNDYYSVTVYENSSNDIYAIGFQGYTPLNGCELITSDAIGDYHYNRPFDVVYTSGSNINPTYLNGYPYIVYGESANLRYMPCQSSTGTFSCGGSSSIKNGATSYYAYWVQAERAADNTLHAAIHDMNDDLVMWTFAPNTWTYRGTVSTNLEKETNHVHEVFSLTTERAAKAMAALSLNTYSDTYYSPYSSNAWWRSTAINTAPSSYERFWDTVKSNADGTKQFVLSMEYTNSTTTKPTLFGSIYSGATWGTWKNFGTVYSDTEYRTDFNYYYNSRTRVFDAAFETSDGHILVVATDPTNPTSMNYWTYNGTTWSSVSTLSFTNLNVHTIRWARLASNPKTDSNEISLIVVADYNATYARAVAKIWNGSSWGNETLLSPDLNPAWSNATETIAVEYMQAGSEVGKAVFAWADQYGSVYGRVWDGASGWGSAQSKGAATEVRVVRLKADPASSNMMLGFETWGKYLYAVKWTGSGWETSSPSRIGSFAYTYPASNDPIHRPFDLCFESGYNHSGHAIFVYGDSGGSNNYYYHYDGSSWGSQGTAYSGSAAYWIELDRANDNTIHMALHEGSGNDGGYTLLWNNSSWITFHQLHAGASALQRGELGGAQSRYPQVFSVARVSTATPEIHALDYNFGAIGATITLHGAGFGVTQGSSTVKFYNNQTATVTSWSDVKIVVTVPASTTSGYVTVTRGSNTDTISFSAVTGAPTITAVLPDKGSNFSDIDMAYITGTNFSPGATVKLTKSGQSDITATNVTLTNSTRIETATLDTTSAAIGYWNVVVTNPDTQTVTSTNAFAIYSPNQVATGTNANYADLASPNERHLVRDSNGNWYAVFFSNDSTKIYITKSTDGSTWDSPTTLVGTGGIITTTAPFRDVSVDIYRTGNITNDRIHIVWRFGLEEDNTKRILYSRCINLASYTSTNSWKQADETTNGLDILDTTTGNDLYRISYPDIAVDAGGYPHVVWFYYAPSPWYFYRIKYITTRPGGTWGSIVNVATENDGDITSGFPSVDTDSSNYVHVSFSQLYTSTNKNIIRYATSTDYNSFTKTDIIADSSIHFYQSSLVIDSANKIYVVALDSTGKDLYWAHYNGSTWSTNNNLTNGSFDIESAVVGAKMGGGITDHILLSKVYDASSNKKVIYWRWEYSTSNWSKYSEDLDTGNASRTYVTLEKHAPASLKTMGYLFYDTAGDSLYFDQFTDLGSNPTGGSYKMEKQVEMQMVETTSFSTTYYDTDIQQFLYYQSGNYDTPGTVSKFYFEAIIKASSGATAYAALYTSGGSYVTGTEVTTTSTSFTRVRSSEITANLTNNTEYRVRIKTSSGGTAYIRNARIVVLQSSAERITKTETHALISGYNRVLESSGTYEEPVENSPHRFYLDKTKFTGTVSAYFEAIISVYSGTGYVRLYDTDGNAYGDELSTSNTSPTRVGGAGSTNIWSSLTSGKTYTLRVKAGVSESVNIDGAKLIIVQSDATNITKTESYYHLDIMGQSYSDTSYTQTYNYNQFNPSNWGPNTPTYFFEAVNARNGMLGITGYMQLYNYTDSSEITSFSMTPVQDPPTRTRTSAITMPSATKTLELREYKTGGASGLYVVASRVIVQSTHTPTVVFLTSFTATGNGKQVKVDWETATEIDNLGFNLYRSPKKGGRYTKLNKRLIPGLISSPTGKSYTYADKNVIKGKLYYYKLEDIDLSGKKTLHGPICVDWNGDGIPDDEQLKTSPSLSVGGSARRPVLVNSTTKSPYDPGSRVIAAEMRSFTARQKENRVLLQWRTAYEVNILGYHVYREENGELLRLTPELVAGSALFAGNALPAGNAYSWWDDLDLRLQTSDIRPQSSGDRAVTYWLEEVALDGIQSWCGPVAPVVDETLKLPEQTASPYSPLLSKLGEEDAENQPPFSIGVRSTLRARNSLASVSAWDLAAEPAVKLSVKERGWYRVTQPELVAAGLDPSVNPLLLQLFVEGEEVPMLVQGEEDGTFDPDDSIEFYGEGLDTLFSDTRVYWVTEGVTSGKRIATVSNQSGLASVEAGFPFTVEIKERSIYFSALKNGEENNFFGPVIGAESVERILDLPYLNVSYPGKAVLKVSLQGVTLKPHSVRVFFNGIAIGKVIFTGQEHKVAQMNISRSRLRRGMNRVRLVALGGDLDVSLLDTVELTYRHTYTAEEDALLSTVSMGGVHTLKGFGSPLIRVADVTNLSEVTIMAGTVKPQLPSGYKITVFNAPRSGTHTWFAFSEEGIKTPAEIKANQVSTWHDAGQGADLVIISHGDFKENLSPLKTHRESQGLSVALIDVEDLYDEFSYGTKTPQAIKDFLTRANSSWQTPPRFVLLVGDASFDPRNYLGLGNQDFLPTKLLDTAYMETASDDWFVDFNGDGLPDMAVGRLPVQTVEETAHVVSKIIAYDQAAAGGWATEALMVADENDSFDFEGAAQEVADLLPEEMTVWSVYRSQAGDETARAAILGSINEGKLLVNYMGHGSVDLWNGSILTADDAALLTNSSRLTLLVGMTCLNGFFQTPYVESLAEALLKTENGGAVAVWTSSGLTYPDAQSLMNKELMRLLFNGQGLTLGEATAQAKAATSDQDVRRTWILFGDPTTRLKY